MITFIEILLIALTIFFEAGGENEQSKIAHAWVIKNRVNHVLFANSYNEVIFHPKHFSCYNPNQIEKHIVRLEFKTFKKCFKIAALVYLNIIPDNTNGALWYTAKYEYKNGKKILLRRKWMETLQINAEYDGTVFYGLKNEENKCDSVTKEQHKKEQSERE